MGEGLKYKMTKYNNCGDMARLAATMCPSIVLPVLAHAGNARAWSDDQPSYATCRVVLHGLLAPPTTVKWMELMLPQPKPRWKPGWSCRV
jgi:hypothetical protein